MATALAIIFAVFSAFCVVVIVLLKLDQRDAMAVYADLREDLDAVQDTAERMGKLIGEKNEAITRLVNEIVWLTQPPIIGIVGKEDECDQ